MDDTTLAFELGDAARRAWLQHGHDSWVTVGRAIVARLRELEANPVDLAGVQLRQVRVLMTREEFERFSMGETK